MVKIINNTFARVRPIFWPSDEPDHIRMAQLDVIRDNMKFAFHGDVVVYATLFFFLGSGGFDAFLLNFFASVVLAFGITTDQRHKDQGELTVRQRLRIYYRSYILRSIPWFGVFFLNWQIQPADGYWAVVIIFLATQSIAMTQCAAYYPLHFSIIAPCILCYWSLLFFSSNQGEYKVVLWCAVPYVILIQVFYAVPYRVILKEINLRLENERLVKLLELDVDRVQAIGQAKSDFFTSASHDLRQPFHALAHFVSAMPERGFSDEQRSVWGRVVASAESCKHLLNNLFEFSRLDGAKLLISPQLFSLDAVIHRIYSDVGHQADGKGIVLRLRESNQWLEADPVVTEQILRNLIVNAVKYTEKGGILVACRSAGRANRIQLEIWDTGPGIGEEEQSIINGDIGEPLRASALSPKGAGLGLGIVRRLLPYIPGATLTIYSRPTVGTMFRIQFPRG